MTVVIPTGARVIEIDLDTTETNIFKNVPYETHEQFYSTDIGMAFLKFTGLAQDYTGCTARLTLINFNDGSKVQRIFEMDTQTTFVYPMLETELIHAGRWIGQLAVIKGGTTISDNPFRFKINGPIMSTALISFDNINTFTSQLTTIYDGLNTFLDVVILDESERSDAEGLRVVAEGLRVTAEELRATAETDRQSTFDANEITRTGIVNSLVTAETIAQKVAEKYQLIESTQANRLLSVEQQLEQKTQEMDAIVANVTVDSEVILARASGVKNKSFTTLKNRLEEVEGDTYFPAANLLPYGDFNSGVTGWTPGASITDLSVTANVATFTGKGAINESGTANWVYSPVIFDANKKYYIAIFAKYNVDASNLQMGAGGAPIVTIPLTNSFAKNSAILTPTLSSRFVFGATLGKNVSVKYAIAINLTDTFGAGKEFTALQMDELLTSFTNSWFSGTKSIANAKRQTLEMAALENKVDTYKDQEVVDARNGELTLKNKILAMDSASSVLEQAVMQETMKPYESILKNGNFALGTSRWIKTWSTDTITSADNSLSINGLPTAEICGARQYGSQVYNAGDKIFVKFKAKVTNDSCLSIRVGYGGSVSGGETVAKITFPVKDVEYDISHVFTLGTGSGDLYIGILQYYNTAVVTEGKVMVISDVVTIDLTKTFGLGNEPTETDMSGILPSLVNTKSQNDRIEILEANTQEPTTIYKRGEWVEAILPERVPTLVMSYDDGLAQDYTVTFPVHEAKGVPGTFAIISSMIDVPGYLSSAQIREMHAAGCEIAIHTQNHVGLDTYLGLPYKLGLPANLGDTTLAFYNPGGAASSPEQWFRRGKALVGIIEEGTKKETFRMRADGTLATPLLNSYTIAAKISHGEETLLYELEYAKRALLAIGIEAKGICYPAGAHSERVRKLVHRYFDWGRALGYQNEPAITIPDKPIVGVNLWDKRGEGDMMAIGTREFATDLAGMTDAQILQMMDYTVAEKGLLSLYSHSTAYLSASRIEWIIDQALAKGIQIKTMSDAVKMFGKPSYKGYADKPESLEISTTMVVGEKGTYVVPDGKSLYVNRGVITRSPDESLWRLSVSDAGVISATRI